MLRQARPVLQAWLPRPVAGSEQQRAQPSAPVAAAVRQKGAAAVLRQARESVLDAGVVPQPAVAARASDAAEERPQAEAAEEVSDAAAVPLRAAGVAELGAAAVPLPGEAAAVSDGAVVPQREAAGAVVSGAAAVRRPAVARVAEWGAAARPLVVRRRGRSRWLHSRRRALRWRLRFSVGAELFLGLRDDEWRGLRMRYGCRELRHGQSGRGKQHEAKVCHDVVPGKNLVATKKLSPNVSAGRSTANH